METKGIILIAAGHPLYTHYAYSLALSIRDHSDIPIILFRQGAGIDYLFDDQKEVFTDIRELPIEFYTHYGREHFVKAKLHLYDLSPFDETIFLDADMIFCDPRISGKKIEHLFAENYAQDIQFACRGEKTMDEKTRSEWVNLQEIKELFGFNHWYELSSELIYFKKTETAKQVFDAAIDYYSNHGMEVKRWIIKDGQRMVEQKKNAIQEFAGGIPDEVPFALALESLRVKIKAPYQPSYWQPQFFMKTIPDSEIQRNHYFVSIGGAELQPNTKRIYNNTVKYYAGKTEKKRVYYAQEKRALIKERKFI